ncbi:MAG: RhaT, partial [Paenibacillaceae bacterium]|nr:RhaT [Paenibacillaceae bacterium]
LLIGAVFATAFAFWAQTHFQRFTTAAHTAIIFASEPVFTAAAAVAIGGESLSFQTLIGGAFILGGILLAELKGNKELDSSLV